MKPSARRYTTRSDWTQQRLIAYGSPAAICVVILQAFLTTPSLDLASLISVLAVAVSLPMLSAAVLMTHAEASYQYATWPPYLTFVIATGQGAAFVAVIAALWHISWIAGTLLLASAFLVLFAYRAYLRRLEAENDAAASPRA